MKNRPTDAELYAEAHRLFRYDPGTGFLYWKVGTKTKRAAERGRAGTYPSDPRQYVSIRVLGIRFGIHRIIWLMHHGYLPGADLDHKDRDHRNNRIGNLREATRLQNRANLTSGVKSKTGTTRTKSGRYDARIGFKGMKLYLGRFDTQREAREAYVKASRELRGEFSPI